MLSKSKCIVLKDTDLNGKTSHRCFQDDLSSLRSPLDMKKQSVFSSIWIQVNTFKIVFRLNAALVLWRLRSKGIFVWRWSVKQRKQTLLGDIETIGLWIQGHHLRAESLSVHSNWLTSFTLSFFCCWTHTQQAWQAFVIVTTPHCHNLEKRLINIHNPMTLQV